MRVPPYDAPNRFDRIAARIAVAVLVGMALWMLLRVEFGLWGYVCGVSEPLLPLLHVGE